MVFQRLDVYFTDEVKKSVLKKTPLGRVKDRSFGKRRN
jgi:hypothetical protein